MSQHIEKIQKKSMASVVLVMGIFFCISLITNIMGPIFPALVKDYNLSLTLAGLFPFSFFIAYGVMSIPAGLLTEALGGKRVILLGLALAGSGALLFVINPSLDGALLSLFLIGSAMAMLQVVINPLLRVAGGASNFAFYSVLAQLVFGVAATFAPHVYTDLTSAIANGEPFVSIIFAWVPQDKNWLSLYAVFAILSFLMLVVTLAMRLPKIDLDASEKAGSLASYLELLKDKKVILYFFAIVCYVASEQGIANSISVFLEREHGFDPNVEGANTLSRFWLMMVFGCILGLALLKLIDSRIVLRIFSIGAICSFVVAVTGSGGTALIFLPLTGFCISVMWSILISLALNSVENHHGSFTGILCTGILGGALASPIIGAIAEFTGVLQVGMLFVVLTLSYILFISFWSKPLVNNKTIFSSPEIESDGDSFAARDGRLNNDLKVF